MSKLKLDNMHIIIENKSGEVYYFDKFKRQSFNRVSLYRETSLEQNVGLNDLGIKPTQYIKNKTSLLLGELQRFEDTINKLGLSWSNSGNINFDDDSDIEDFSDDEEMLGLLDDEDSFYDFSEEDSFDDDDYDTEEYSTIKSSSQSDEELIDAWNTQVEVSRLEDDLKETAFSDTYVIDDKLELVYDIIKYKEPVLYEEYKDIEKEEIVYKQLRRQLSGEIKDNISDEKKFVIQEFGKRDFKEFLAGDLSKIFNKIAENNLEEDLTYQPKIENILLLNNKYCFGMKYSFYFKDFENTGYSVDYWISNGNIVKIVIRKDDETTYNIFTGVTNFSKVKLNKRYKGVPYFERKSNQTNKKFRKAFNTSSLELLTLPTRTYYEEKYNLPNFDKVDYQIVNTEELLNKMISDIESLVTETTEVMHDPETGQIIDEKTVKKYPILSVDVETTGLKFYKFIPEEEKDKAVTISISWKPGMSRIIPIRMRYCKNLPVELVVEKLKPILETYPILAQNGAADVRFLYEDGIFLNLKEDLFLLMKHLFPYLATDENSSGLSNKRSKLRRGLEVPVKHTTGYDMLDLKKEVFTPNKLDFDFSLLNEEYMIIYGCPDTDLLLRAWSVMRTKLETRQLSAYKNTVEASKNLAILATYYGIGISKEIFIDHEKILLDDLKLIEETIYKVTGETPKSLSITSPPQIVNYIYGVLNVPITHNTKRSAKTGELTADKAVLKELSELKLAEAEQTAVLKEDLLSTEFNGAPEQLDSDGKPLSKYILLKSSDINARKYPFCYMLLKYRELHKIYTGYYNKISNNSINGMIHPEYGVGKTVTWRTTEGIQTTKGSLKSGFCVHDPDEYYMFGFDYSTEEVRLAVNQSTDENLINSLKDPELDIHAKAASDLFGVPIHLVDKGLRSKAKACNFGIIYGIKPKRLASNIYGVINPTKEQIDDTTEVYNLYCRKYEKILDPLKSSMDFLMSKGYLYNRMGYKVIYDDVIDLDRYESAIFDSRITSPVKVPIDSDLMERFGWSLLNKAGNYPIQSWAGGILLENINKFCKRLQKEGLWGKVFLPLAVHDECNFIVHKSVNPFHILTIVKEVFELDMEKILGKNACPLYIGCGFGMSWGECKADERELPVKLQNQLIEEFKNGTYKKDFHPREIPQYFLERKYQFFRERLAELFVELKTNPVLETGKYTDILSKELFVTKNANELLVKKVDGKKITIKSGSSSYNFDYILEIISPILGINPKDIEIVETESLTEQQTKFQEDLIPRELITLTKKVLHKRLEVSILKSGSRLILNLENINKEKQKKLLQYIKNFKVPSEDLNKYPEASDLFVKVSSSIIDTKVKINGLPNNVNQHIENILNNKEPFILKETVLDEENRYYYENEYLYIKPKTKQNLLDTISFLQKENKIISVGTPNKNLLKGGKVVVLQTVEDSSINPKNLIIRKLSISDEDKLNRLLNK